MPDIDESIPGGHSIVIYRQEGERAHAAGGKSVSTRDGKLPVPRGISTRSSSVGYRSGAVGSRKPRWLRR
eukprot:10353914-Prorocentrum_lima.AAC.1